MGKSAPSPPPAPDPTIVAQAQGAANEQTARTQAALNRVNQYGPDGSVTYSYNGPDSYSVHTALSPDMQRIYDATRSAQNTYGQIGNAQLGGVQKSLSQPYQNPYAQNTADAIARANAAGSQPINTNYDQVRQQAIDAATSRLDPMFARDEEAMRSRLLASGIGQGSKAWSSEYGDFNQGKNDARMQAIMNAEGLAGQAIQQTGMLRQMPMQEAGQLVNLSNAGMTQGIASRSVPLNETAALLTGQQVQIPGLQQIPQTQVAPTDVVGAYGLNQAAQNAGYQGRLSAYNAGLGGMYGLGSSAILGAAMFSDRRLKTDIRKVGKTEGGSNLYFYRYKDDPGRTPHIGVMAQELRKTRPDAVVKVGGFYAVDYDKVA